MMGMAFVFGVAPASGVRVRLAASNGNVSERRSVLHGTRVGSRGGLGKISAQDRKDVLPSRGMPAVLRAESNCSSVFTSSSGCGSDSTFSGRSREMPVITVLRQMLRLASAAWKRMLLVCLAALVACAVGITGQRSITVQGPQHAQAATVSRVARVSYGGSSSVAKKSDTQTLLMGTLAAAGVMMVVKTLRTKATKQNEVKDEADIEVVRYDKVMEEQWKKEDREKKASAAREATSSDIMEELQKRLADIEETLPDDKKAEKPQEMTDIIKSLEQMWGEDKSGKESDSDSDDSSDSSIRMGSWGGTGSALLEPPSGSTPEPNEQPKDEEPPQIPAETLRMLRSCWDASDDEGGSDKDLRKKGKK